MKWGRLRRFLAKHPDETYSVSAAALGQLEHFEWPQGVRIVEAPEAATVAIITKGEQTSCAKNLQLVAYPDRLRAWRGAWVDMARLEPGSFGGVVTQGFADRMRAHWVVFGLFLIIFSLLGLYPSDDLLRHIVAYRHNFDYSQIFLYTQLPQTNFYLTFDWLVGWFHQWFSASPDSIVPLMIVRALIGAVVAFGLLLNTSDCSDSTRRALLFGLGLVAVDTRIYLGRPGTLVLGLFLIAISSPVARSRLWSGLVGFLLAISYWLSWIFLIPLVLRNRVHLVFLAFSFLFWNAVMGGAYPDAVLQLFRGLEVTSVVITENESLLLYAQPIFYLLLAINLFKLCREMSSGTPWAQLFHKNLFLVMALWFALPNMSRYLEVIVPLLLFNAWRDIVAGFDRVLRHPLLRYGVAGWLLFFFFNATVPVLAARQKPIPGPQVRELLSGQRVMTTLDDMFTLVYAIEDLQVAPSFEPRWSDPRVLKIWSDMRNERTIGCADLQSLGFNYLVEADLAFSSGPPECLSLAATEGGRRVWKIHGAKEKGGSLGQR